MDVTPQIGSGARRLGSYLELGEDIYSMLYVACLNADYHFYNQYVLDKLEDLHDQEHDDMIKNIQNMNNSGYDQTYN